MLWRKDKTGKRVSLWDKPWSFPILFYLLEKELSKQEKGNEISGDERIISKEGESQVDQKPGKESPINQKIKPISISKVRIIRVKPIGPCARVFSRQFWSTARGSFEKSRAERQWQTIAKSKIKTFIYLVKITRNPLMTENSWNHRKCSKLSICQPNLQKKLSKSKW